MERIAPTCVPYTLPLADSRATLEAAGGKGASLARLSAAGLPVPGGFHIITEAYRQFVTANNLQPAIQAGLEKADAALPATLETASEAISKRFLEGQIPGEIAEAITQACAGLGGAESAVAVRSSATAEDLPGLSFAGQQDTYLNIRGIEAVLASVKRCWASLWTARAIGYRQQHGIDQNALSLAVVVQRLVLAEASGILFSANPVSGRRDQAVISAAWGLGEAIVGGTVTPDTLVVDKSTRRVVTRETANKQVMTVRYEGGTEERPVPDAKRRAPVLNDEAAAELVQMGVQIEELYALPMDIEWALAEGKFAILQARPITALPEPEALLPTEWKIPNPKEKYIRGSILEFLPDPMTPLFGTLGRDVVDALTRRFFETVAGRDFWPGGMIVTVNGYAYSAIPSGRQMLALIRGVFPAIRLFREAEKRWQQDGLLPYLQVLDRWQAKPLADLTAGEILAAAREILAAAVNLYTIIQSGVIGNAVLSEALFSRVYDRLMKRPDDPPALTYLLGFDSTPILAEKSLYDLAEACRARPSLVAYLSHTPARQAATQLQGEQAPDAVEAGEWKEWRGRWRTHLQRYGHILYDLDFAKPVPADDPAPLVETCRLFLSGQIGSPYSRQRALAERRERATHEMAQRLKGFRLILFRSLVTWAQKCIPLREEGIADMGRGYPFLRQMLLKLGRRLVQQGGIEDADDVFWLYQAEVEQAAKALDRGEPVATFSGLIPERKAVWRAEKRLVPPTELPPRTKWLGINLEGLLPAHSGDQSGDTLKGTGASMGVVTAAACVIRGPEDFDRMRPGNILVAAITTPAWTPLFAMAAAVVTDVGGPLSHSSIVAREYGIPAVLGTAVATSRIRTGQIITVDGGAGTVRIADRQAS
ncbi:MAG: PEP/pyruvate-binding domain-containing protein [Anaerolineales bacterium]|jgi:pyruvate,water dikinase